MLICTILLVRISGEFKIYVRGECPICLSNDNFFPIYLMSKECG